MSEREALMNYRDFSCYEVRVIEKDAEGIKRINPLPLRARYSDERESRMETCPDNFYDPGTLHIVFVTNLYVLTLLARSNQGRNQEMKKNKKNEKEKNKQRYLSCC